MILLDNMTIPQLEQAVVAAILSTLLPHASPTTRKSPGIARTTSRVLSPIDPVLPRTMILFTRDSPYPPTRRKK